MKIILHLMLENKMNIKLKDKLGINKEPSTTLFLVKLLSVRINLEKLKNISKM